MDNKQKIVEVYTPKPELTMYRDTYLKCVLVDKEKNQQSRLKIVSVHTGKGGLLADLTAERVDEVIVVDNDDVFHNLEEMKQVLINQI